MKRKPLLLDEGLESLDEAKPATHSVAGAPDASGLHARTEILEAGVATPGRDAAGHERPRPRFAERADAAPATQDRVAPERSVAGEDAGGTPILEMVGWLVVVSGPGRGAAHPLRSGLNGIGRGPDNSVPLTHGDEGIETNAHAFVAYDPETRLFHSAHGGKADLVRINGAPLLRNETLQSGDEISLGATRLRFVPLCGPGFDWSSS